MDTPKFNIRIPSELMAQVRQIAEKMHCPASYVIRLAIAKYVKEKLDGKAEG